MSLSEAAAAIHARVRGEDIRFDSVSTDSRTLARGALFVALRGERFDGHRFIEAAAGRGAAAAMVDEDSGPGSSGAAIPFLVVDDTRRALGRLARRWRARFTLPLVAVTGSNGKTTVKEMIAAILRAHYGEASVLATEGNLNNDIGVPLTLLGLREAAPRGGGRAGNESSRRDRVSRGHREPDRGPGQQRPARASGIHERRGRGCP